MGIGDEVMATGMARGAAARGKRIAFGDGTRLRWSHWCEEAFKHNPNIARQATGPDIEWIKYYKGNRHYNSWDGVHQRWIWNYKFKASRGEFFELGWRDVLPSSVLIEPNVPWHKPISQNKDWGWLNYQTLADRLRYDGWQVLQTSYGKVRLRNVQTVQVKSYREAANLLRSVNLAIVPEGGLHHAAAAVGTKAIVIFGGAIPPAVLGYDEHINLTGCDEACGSTLWCKHCADAMKNISVEEVFDKALSYLNDASPLRSLLRASDV